MLRRKSYEGSHMTINEATLCENMVKYEVVVSPVAAIKLCQIESDYFSS